MKITPERLKEVLEYNECTGDFMWKKKLNRKIMPGAIAGSVDKNGRRIIHIDKEGYFAHRLAWLYVNGSMPHLLIDHINGEPSDNRISNLREVTPVGNSQNLRKQRPGCLSGLLGAGKGRNGRWRSTIKINGKSKYLGEFKTPDEAHSAYVAAKRIYHATCTI